MATPVLSPPPPARTTGADISEKPEEKVPTLLISSTKAWWRGNGQCEKKPKSNSPSVSSHLGPFLTTGALATARAWLTFLRNPTKSCPAFSPGSTRTCGRERAKGEKKPKGNNKGSGKGHGNGKGNGEVAKVEMELSAPSSVASRVSPVTAAHRFRMSLLGCWQSAAATAPEGGRRTKGDKTSPFVKIASNSP